jgi:iron complex outermembrane receptor protein
MNWALMSSPIILVQMPGITAGGSGPGQNTIYIRGVASTTPNLTTAGVAGLAPNVALYLDEQPLTQPGRNLDVYAVDMERVEVLSGPQGTLFGASSQAGVVRLITNKPKLDELTASHKLSFAHTPEGEASRKMEAVVNAPLGPRTAVRVVAYSDYKGGFIDNVRGTRSMEDAGAFNNTATTERSNGVAYGDARKGKYLDELAGVANFIEADNLNYVGEDINDSTYSGIRTSLLHEFNDDTSLLIGYTSQTLEADGAFFIDPNLGDLEIQRFNNDTLDDEITNLNWTLETRLGALDMVYAGGFSDRDSTQFVDYTDYLYTGFYLPYYVCDNSGVGYAGGAYLDIAENGTCHAPFFAVDASNQVETISHEVRFTGTFMGRFDTTFGAFVSETELKELNEFVYFGMPDILVDGDADGDMLTGTPLADQWANSYGYNVAGASSPNSKFGKYTGFRNDVTRTDDQFGVFGEVSFDVMPDLVNLTLGVRHYDVSSDMEGSANGVFNMLGNSIDSKASLNETPSNSPRGAGTNITAKYGPNRDAGVPDAAEDKGEVFKLSLAYTPREDLMLYSTYSEGFRPGVLNRPGGRTNNVTGGTVPFEVKSDTVENYEIGIKTTTADGRLRVNANAFKIEITDLQTTIFDPAVTNLFFSDNAADAEITGLEGTITWLPKFSDNLTVNASFSLLDSEVTVNKTGTDDVVVGDDLPYAPEVQYSVSGRYEWQMESGFTAHIMPSVSYSDEKYSDLITINRTTIDDYMLVNISAGITGDDWGIELYADNLTDERAEQSRNYIQHQDRATIVRPLTIGIRLSQDF